MRMMALAIVAAMLTCLSSVARAQDAATKTQTAEVSKGFRIDPKLPFVYLKFDHAGEGARVRDSEPAGRIWLRLVNNCRLPIVIVDGGHRRDGVPGEDFLFPEVMANRFRGVTIDGSAAPAVETESSPLGSVNASGENGKQGALATKAPENEQPKPAPDPNGKMPDGYLSTDALNYKTILPGHEVLFSVPVSFVGTKWHFELSFDFDSEGTTQIPERSAFPAADVSGHPAMVVTFYEWDIPENQKVAVERLRRDITPAK